MQAEVLLKQCFACLESKPLGLFYKDKSKKFGVGGECKDCCKTRVKLSHGLNRTQRLQCMKEYHHKNRSKLLERMKRWALENPERKTQLHREWYEQNKESFKHKMKEYRTANPSKVIAWSNKRRAAKLERTPSWLTDVHFQQIEMFYEAANRLGLELGIKLHVDHIIPLQGKDVSGLHVPWNLQVISAFDNISKKNRVKL